MKISSDATAALLSFALYHVMMLPNVQASGVVRGHRDNFSSPPHHRHLDDGPCGVQDAGLGFCLLENESCLSFGRNRRLEDTIASCEEYESQICLYDIIFPECPCFDEYKAQVECQAEQAGLTCESSPDCCVSGLSFCLLENESCFNFGDGDDDSGRNRRLEDTITSCEEYESQICLYDIILPECPCFDEYKAELECQAEQAGLTCESSPDCDSLCTVILYEVGVCISEDENCLGVFDDDGGSSGVDDGTGEDDDGAFASCEDYNEALNLIDTDYAGCKCDLKTAVECAAELQGLICDSAEPTKSPVTPAPVDDTPPPTPSAGTSPQKNVLLISIISMVMSAAVPFSAIFM